MTHPPSEVLQFYATGATDLTRRLLVEAHLTLCPACATLVTQLRDPGERLPEATITDDVLMPSFERLWHAVEKVDGARARVEAAAVLPGPYRAPVGLRWMTMWPQRTRSAVLARDGATRASLYLSYYPPDSIYPRHRHLGLEENVILAGGYQNGDVHVEAGDWVIGAPGTEHRPATGPEEECWCLSRVEPPGVRFSAWRELARRLTGV